MGIFGRIRYGLAAHADAAGAGRRERQGGGIGWGGMAGTYLMADPAEELESPMRIKSYPTIWRVTPSTPETCGICGAE